MSLTTTLAAIGLDFLAEMLLKLFKPAVWAVAQFLYDVVEDWAVEMGEKVKTLEGHELRYLRMDKPTGKEKAERFEVLFALASSAGVVDPLAGPEIRTLIELTHLDKLDKADLVEANVEAVKNA